MYVGEFPGSAGRIKTHQGSRDRIGGDRIFTGYQETEADRIETLDSRAFATFAGQDAVNDGQMDRPGNIKYSIEILLFFPYKWSIQPP